MTTIPAVTTAREPNRRAPIPAIGPADAAPTAPGSRKKPISVALAPKPYPWAETAKNCGTR